MNKYSIKLWIIAILSFAVFFSPATISASENPCASQSKPHSDKDVALVKQIGSYLEDHCLFPFIDEGKAEYVHLAFQTDPHDNTIYELGILSQYENGYWTMFSIKKGWIWDEVKLVYLTNDEPLSPTVFNDIIPIATPLLSKQIPDYHIFIEAIEDTTLSEGEKLQRWIFFNPSEYAELYILMKDDGHGGTYFSILPPK